MSGRGQKTKVATAARRTDDGRPEPAARYAAGRSARARVPVEAHAVYGARCGWTLARAHARTGDRIAIAGYLGEDDAFDRALVEFGERYADRNEADFQLLQEAGRTGRITVQSGL